MAAKKLIIIMANTDPRNSEELGAPIFQASVAAAMGYEVEVICTATATKLMRIGVASELKQAAGKTVYDFIKEAHDAGVKFFCCSPGLDEHAHGRLDPRVQRHRGRGALHRRHHDG